MNELLIALKEIKSVLLYCNKEVFTLVEFAAYAGISVQTAYKYTARRLIPYHKRGKHLYLKREDVIEFLLSNPVLSNTDIEKQAMDSISNSLINNKIK